MKNSKAAATQTESAQAFDSSGTQRPPHAAEKEGWTTPQVGGRACDQVEKTLDRCDKLFFLHMRKAAGTSIRNFLESISDRTGLEVEVQEGNVLDHKRAAGESTFRMTCLRDPLDRICSLYNYQGRWMLPERSQMPRNGRPFEEWLTHIPTPRKWRLWDESADYYIKTLADGPVDQRGIGADEKRFERARRVLDTFDLVLISEGFGDAEYDRWWSERLGLRSSAKLPRNRPTAGYQSHYDIREHLTEDLIAAVDARNRWDRELYRYARERSPIRIRPDTESPLRKRSEELSRTRHDAAQSAGSRP